MPAVALQMLVSSPAGSMSFQGRQLIKMTDKFGRIAIDSLNQQYTSS